MESRCAARRCNGCRPRWDRETLACCSGGMFESSKSKYIGKESNSLEDVESGMIHSAENVYTEYPDPRRDEWETKIRPALRKIPVPVLEKESGLSRMMLINAVRYELVFSWRFPPADSDSFRTPANWTCSLNGLE